MTFEKFIKILEEKEADSSQNAEKYWEEGNSDWAEKEESRSSALYEILQLAKTIKI